MLANDQDWNESVHTIEIARGLLWTPRGKVPDVILKEGRVEAALELPVDAPRRYLASVL